MPPRFAYWTILIDNAPTAFRARDRADLMGVFRQLSRRNPNATIKWFSNGRLWDSPEEARAQAKAGRRTDEPRGPEWRPGGRHADPRARFAKKDRPNASSPRSRDRQDKRAGSGQPERPAGRDRPLERDNRERRERTGRDRRPTVGRPPRQGDEREPRSRPSGREDSWRQRHDRHSPHGGRTGQPGQKDGNRKGGRPRRDAGGRERRPADAEPGGQQQRTRTDETRSEPEAPPPPQPPSPERPPKPGHEPLPDVPSPETIKILPEPPERAGDDDHPAGRAEKAKHELPPPGTHLVRKRR